MFQKVSFSGGNRQVIRANIPTGYGIAVFGDYVYWSDRNLKKIQRALKDPMNITDPAEVIRSNINNLKVLAVYDDSAQPDGRHTT